MVKPKDACKFCATDKLFYLQSSKEYASVTFIFLEDHVSYLCRTLRLLQPPYSLRRKCRNYRL
jgi:hypothetical protein